MTIEQAALQHIEQRALQASAIEGTSTPARLVPHDVKIQSLEGLMVNRSRYRGTFASHLIAEFASYAATFPGGATFVDQDKVSARAFFNLGTTEEPGHGDHYADVKLQATAPFLAFRAVVTKQLSQKALAEWMEEWAPYLTAFDGAGITLHFGQAVAAVRRITIGAKKEITTSQGDFSASRTGFEQIEARSEEQLPAGFRFESAPYHGLDSRSFELRLSVITGDEPRLVLRDVRFEEAQEAIAQEFADKLKTALKSAGAEADLFIGTFAVGA